MTLYSNAGRDIHHGPKIGLDFVRIVPSSHGEKQKSFKITSASPTSHVLKQKEFTNTICPFWILSLSNKTGRKPCQDPCRRETHPTLIYLMLSDFRSHHKTTCTHSASKTKSPPAFILDETKQLGVLLGPYSAFLLFMMIKHELR